MCGHIVGCHGCCCLSCRLHVHIRISALPTRLQFLSPSSTPARRTHAPLKHTVCSYVIRHVARAAAPGAGGCGVWYTKLQTRDIPLVLSPTAERNLFPHTKLSIRFSLPLVVLPSIIIGSDTKSTSQVGDADTRHHACDCTTTRLRIRVSQIEFGARCLGLQLPTPSSPQCVLFPVSSWFLRGEGRGG